MMDGTKKAEADAFGFCVVAGCLLREMSDMRYLLDTNAVITVQFDL
jgi:hypothetical protein